MGKYFTISPLSHSHPLLSLFYPTDQPGTHPPSSAATIRGTTFHQHPSSLAPPLSVPLIISSTIVSTTTSSLLKFMTQMPIRPKHKCHAPLPPSHTDRFWFPIWIWGFFLLAIWSEILGSWWRFGCYLGDWWWFWVGWWWFLSGFVGGWWWFRTGLMGCWWWFQSGFVRGWWGFQSGFVGGCGGCFSSQSRFLGDQWWFVQLHLHFMCLEN